MRPQCLPLAPLLFLSACRRRRRRPCPLPSARAIYLSGGFNLAWSDLRPLIPPPSPPLPLFSGSYFAPPSCSLWRMKEQRPLVLLNFSPHRCCSPYTSSGPPLITSAPLVRRRISRITEERVQRTLVAGSFSVRVKRPAGKTGAFLLMRH